MILFKSISLYKKFLQFFQVLQFVKGNFKKKKLKKKDSIKNHMGASLKLDTLDVLMQHDELNSF
jgi:hypothetical protein